MERHRGQKWGLCARPRVLASHSLTAPGGETTVVVPHRCGEQYREAAATQSPRISAAAKPPGLALGVRAENRP